MKDIPLKPTRRLRCAVYTRKSSEEGLEQEFNCVFHAMMGTDSTRRWAVIPRDRGQV